MWALSACVSSTIVSSLLDVYGKVRTWPRVVDTLDSGWMHDVPSILRAFPGWQHVLGDSYQIAWCLSMQHVNVCIVNTVMCAKHVEAAEHPLASDRLARLTPQIARSLPKDFLNCIIGISAIHMSIRHPGNSAVTRLALEMKNELFEGINNAFLQPHMQRADVLFICIALMFAMEVCIHYLRLPAWCHNLGTSMLTTH